MEQKTENFKKDIGVLNEKLNQELYKNMKLRIDINEEKIQREKLSFQLSHLEKELTQVKSDFQESCDTIASQKYTVEECDNKIINTCAEILS